MEVTFAEVLGWARKQGAEWSDALELRDGARGRGVFASRRISRGELILRLPTAIAVRPASAFADLVRSGECSAMLALVLTAMHEIHVVQPPTPFFAFLAATPPPLVPMLWDDEDIGLLAGTMLLPTGCTSADAADAARSAFEQDVQPVMEKMGQSFLPKSVRTQAAFASALANVVSHALQGRVAYEHGSASLWPYLRADGPPTASQPGGAGPFLLPLLDQLNHSSDPSDICTRLSTNEGGFEMRALRDIAVGDELLHSYGRQGSADLLRTYGFVEPGGSPHSALTLTRQDVAKAACAAILKAEAAKGVGGNGTSDGSGSATLERAGVRMAALEAAGLLPAAFTIGVVSEVPRLLLTVVQVLLMTEDEYAAWREAGAIVLGAEFLDDDALPAIVGCLLHLSAAAPRIAVSSAVSSAVAEAHLVSGSDRIGSDRIGSDRQSEAASLAELLRREEAGLARTFRGAVLALESAAGDEDDEEDEDDGEDSEEEEEEDEDEEEDEEEEEEKKGEAEDDDDEGGELEGEAHVAGAGQRNAKRRRTGTG